MSSGHRTVVFTTLAMNQTRFFYALGTALERLNCRVSYVCFHDRSHEFLTSVNARTYNAFVLGQASRTSPEKYGIENVNALINHEKAAYEVSDSKKLQRKFESCLAAMEAVFQDLGHDGHDGIWLVQELGGFLGLLAAFFVARAQGIPNIFIEPSFFRGRVFFVRDTLAALPIGGPNGKSVSGEVSARLTHILDQQTVVIPVKDRRHYRAPFRKLLDSYNLRRLGEKWYDKHILGKREEFEHISGHVSRHARMSLNQVRQNRLYQSIPERPFVYYPLHVPADFALTIRSPEYFDQVGLIDFMARALPHTHNLAIKEHPALVGAMSYRRLREVLHAHDNLLMLDPAVNNYEVMKRAGAVVTVNSKSGAEALLLGKPVLVLGDAFYRASNLVRKVDRLGDLPKILGETLRSPPEIDFDDIKSYFQNVWDQSHRGELYDLDARNIAEFSRSLEGYLDDA